jgi:bacterioferritin-associated ferredoxin
MRIVRIMLRDMVICLCHRISDRDIAREARSGCMSFDDLQDATRVATACGVCLDCAVRTFEQHRVDAGAPGAGASARGCSLANCPA